MAENTFVTGVGYNPYKWSYFTWLITGGREAQLVGNNSSE